MAWGYYGRWPTYVPVAELRKKAERQLKKLRKNRQPVSPVTIEGRTIARTFWGKAWCDNLETYRDYENRLPRGRSYVRNGLACPWTARTRSRPGSCGRYGLPAACQSRFAVKALLSA